MYHKRLEEQVYIPTVQVRIYKNSVRTQFEINSKKLKGIKLLHDKDIAKNNLNEIRPRQNCTK